MKTEISAEGLKAAPPVAVTVAATVADLTLNQLVAYATLVYLGLQAGYLLWKWFREYRAAKKADRSA